MIRKIALLLIFSACFSAYSQKNYTQFRNGKFRVTDPKSQKVCIITRDGDTQTEKMEESDEVYDFDIKWLDDCTYIVTPTPATIARNKDVLKAGTMTVKITKAKDSTYVQNITVANYPKFRRSDTVYLVKDKKEKE
jgi:hypothetical protein